MEAISSRSPVSKVANDAIHEISHGSKIERVNQRLSALVQMRGANPSTAHRFIAAEPTLAARGLRWIKSGVYEDEGIEFSDFGKACELLSTELVILHTICSAIPFYARFNAENSDKVMPWLRHAIAASVVAYAAADSFGVSKWDATISAAYQNIGIPALSTVKPNLYSVVMGSKGLGKLHDFESLAIGTSHAEIAGIALHQLKFPAQIVAAIHDQHTKRGELTALGQVLRFSDSVASQMGFNLGFAFDGEPFQEQWMEKIDGKLMETICARVLRVDQSLTNLLQSE